MMMGNGDAPASQQLDILFDVSKKETGSPNSSYKKLYRRLRSEYKCGINKDIITLDRLKEANLVIFAGPKEMFSSDEFFAIKAYIQQGGSVLYLLGEGGEAKFLRTRRTIEPNSVLKQNLTGYRIANRS